jgi:chromosome segregation ATPase
VRISRNSGAFGKLDLNFNQETFSISGPNGSGKSGVINTIEFAMAAWDEYTASRLSAHWGTLD